MQPILEWWEQFSQRPFVAHLLRAVDRFNLRGGVQLAAAITYFSVLSLVPILMLVVLGARVHGDGVPSGVARA